MRPRWILLALSVVVLVATAGGVGLFLQNSRARWMDAELSDARRDLEANRPHSAGERLKRLFEAAPGRSDIAFLLAQAEFATGKTDHGLALLDEITVGSNEIGTAAAIRSRFEIQNGSLDLAETNLEKVLDDSQNQAAKTLPEARDALVRLLRSEGRFAEARRRYLEGSSDWRDSVVGMKGLHRLDVDPIATEGLRVYLERANHQKPNDDRVWLGLAALETSLGRFDEAKTWLDACLKQRPDDLPVWSARLQWAKESRQPIEAFATLKHLPADSKTAEELRSWFASIIGDRLLEMKALEAWNVLEPGRPATLSRLAELAAEESLFDDVAKYRSQSSRLSRARDAYESLLSRSADLDAQKTLAELAAELGKGFEAYAWKSIATGKKLRWSAQNSSVVGSKNLADLLPEINLERLAKASSKSVRSKPDGVKFSDDAEAAGLQFVHENGASNDPTRLIPPVSASGGVGLLDFDGDGWLDVYCVQSGSFPQGSPTGEGDRLYRNRRDGTFEDASLSTGIDHLVRGYGHGIAVGDFDGDGHPDIFLTRWRSYILLRNRGDGTFENATEQTMLQGDRDWPTSAAFADLDNDGDLDLYVCHYFEWDENDDRTCADPKNPGAYRCTPLAFRSRQDHLFRNDGGRFIDISQESGIADIDKNGRGLGVVAADLDGDHFVDLFVSNDMSANYYLHNLGGLKFEDWGLESGTASNSSGNFQAGMGTACGDFDGDGRPDLFVTNFFGESTTFYRNLRDGVFGDDTAAIGLSALSRNLLGFGIALPDVDNDGNLDILTANGHIHDGRPQFPYKMPIQLCLGGGEGKVQAIDPAKTGKVFETERLGRGLAAGDLDNDGKVDALVVSQNDPLIYLHNTSESAGHHLTLLLEGTESNRDGVGVELTVRTGLKVQNFQRVGGGSYLSAADPRIAIGLGEAAIVDALEIRWPSGRTARYEHVEADTGYRVLEGSPRLEPLQGFISKSTDNETPSKR